jgi:ribonuclease-3
LREPAERLARVLGHSFRDPDRLERALTHRSADSANNERLEFLGDAFLGFVVAESLYNRFPDADEGTLSRLRAGLVKKDSLAQVARSLDLGAYLNLGSGELRSGGHARASILADALEAIIAAVYLDGGGQAARELILRLFQGRLAQLDPQAPLKDPKTRLQEFLQAHRLGLPEYEILSVGGTQHQQSFEVLCRVGDLDRESRGSGGSRRKAEQAAARAMLGQLPGGEEHS